MTTKRYKKLCMSQGVDRNLANELALQRADLRSSWFRIERGDVPNDNGTLSHNIAGFLVKVFHVRNLHDYEKMTGVRHWKDLRIEHGK